MSDVNEHIHVEFHNKARTIFINTLKEFEYSAKILNREAEEYRFTSLKEKFAATLKRQLEEVAQNLIQHYKYSTQLPELYQSLQKIIMDYLHQFVVKTRAM